MEIKIVQLFDTYDDFYQPYIPPVMEALKIVLNFEIQINAFRGEACGNVQIIPSYYRRKLYERILSISKRSSKQLSYLENKYLKNKVDIIHLQHSYLHKKIKGLLSLPSVERPKIIITLRGADTYVKPWVDKNWLHFYNNDGNNIDAFVVMSEHQKQYLHKHWGIKLDKIHVIPISFGNKQTHIPKTLDSKSIKIISAFRLCWEKNIEGNLRVIKHLKEQGLPVQYDLYGDGPDVGQVYYLIDKYGLSDCVNYHGRIANETLKVRLLASDFYLQLSHSESLGMSVIEAQTLGLPAILSNSGGLSETIIPNKSGYAVEADDIEAASKCIIDLYSNPLKYNQFSQNAILHSQTHFAIENEVKRLTLLYKNLLE